MERLAKNIELNKLQEKAVTMKLLWQQFDAKQKQAMLTAVAAAPAGFDFIIGSDIV